MHEKSFQQPRTLNPTRPAIAPFRLASLPYQKQHAFPTTTALTKKAGFDGPNGTSDSQGDALSKHELSRIHHELAINIHRPLIAFHRPFIASSQKGAAPGHALFLRQQCTLYILHCTLKKGQNRLASYRRPSGFGICFFNRGGSGRNTRCSCGRCTWSRSRRSRPGSGSWRRRCSPA